MFRDWNRFSRFDTTKKNTCTSLSHLSVRNIKFSENLSMNDKKNEKENLIEIGLFLKYLKIYNNNNNKYTYMPTFSSNFIFAIPTNIGKCVFSAQISEHSLNTLRGMIILLCECDWNIFYEKWFVVANFKINNLRKRLNELTRDVLTAEMDDCVGENGGKVFQC